MTDVELERAATSCIFPGFEGGTAPEWVRRWLADGLGGVVLFSRNVESPEQLRALTSALRAEKEDVLVAIDEEGGDVTRLEAGEGSSYPGNAALGAVDDVGLTERVAAAIGADLAEVGVNLDLAPVADVNSNPLNPVIGIRSFGSDEDLVARHASAFVRGMQRTGVAACAKHFPGHGDTSEDSHLALPVVDAAADDALLPFRAAVDAGVQVVMTAHIVVRALGNEPATTNPRVLQGLLRDRLGFQGMVLTDALEMGAISATAGVEEGAVRALAAGADGLCLGHDLFESSVRSVRDALLDAVRDGRLQESRLAEAAGRVQSTAAWAFRPSGPERVERGIGSEAAARALRISGEARPTRAPLLVELRPEPGIAAGELPQGPAEWFAGVVPETEAIRLSDADVTPVLAQADGRQLVVVARDAHRHAWEREAVEALLARVPDAVVVEIGLPLWRPDAAETYVATYGAGRVNVQAAAEALYSGTRRGVEQSGSSPGS